MPNHQTIIAGKSAVLALENFALSRYGTAITSNGDASESLSASNLTVDNVDASWRSESLLSYGGQNPKLTIDFGIVRTIGAISFHHHNIRNVPFIVRLYRSKPPAEPVLTLGPIDPIVRALLSEFTWYTLRWNLGPADSELRRMQERFRLSSICFFDQQTDATHIEIEFDMTNLSSNDGVDYLHMGYLMAYLPFRPHINIVYGSQFKIIDRSTAIRDESGNIGGREQERPTAVSVTLPKLTDAEAFESIGAALINNGTLGKVFFIPYPHKRRYFYQTAVLGTMSQMPSLTVVNDNQISVAQVSIEGV